MDMFKKNQFLLGVRTLKNFPFALRRIDQDHRHVTDGIVCR
jgi:hypothetical protein